jgi:hypothetical protein
MIPRLPFPGPLTLASAGVLLCAAALLGSPPAEAG